MDIMYLDFIYMPRTNVTLMSVIFMLYFNYDSNQIHDHIVLSHHVALSVPHDMVIQRWRGTDQIRSISFGSVIILPLKGKRDKLPY